MNPSSSALVSVCKRKRDPDDASKPCKRPKHDVFINYSSDKIGKSFVSHLKGSLKLKSFSISDHTMLPVGQDEHSELTKAIEESEIYVVVFSPDYASSTRCLDELVHIMEHNGFRKRNERKVVPVFFKVEPSYVRSQQGPFMEAFQTHRTNLDPERVQKWSQALKDAGRLSGLELQNGDEAKFLSDIIEQLEKMQRPQELHVTEHPVGIGSRAEELISTLRLNQKDGVLVVAVFGISGIGKTTVVKEAYNRISHRFDLSCFLADIHSICQAPNWKVKLPKKLISCLTRDNKFSFMGSHNDGVTKIRQLVSGRKVLLVLDDIDSFQQLESLGIRLECFYKGSRIIVTTRDKRSLGSIPYASYQTRLLNRRESFNLFTRLLFVRDDNVNTIMEKVVACAGGLPLVLKVWSCHLKQCEREQWPTVLETLKAIPHGDIQKQLQLSYDSLPSRAKKLFLDIACFFDYGERADKDLLVKVLQDEDSKFFPDNEIQYLVDRSLVEITSYNRLQMWMPRAIREMGQEIVRKENEEEPGQRTRLQNETDVKRVLSECSGTELVESISGPLADHNGIDDIEAFSKMINLRLINYWGPRGLSKFSHDEMTPLSFKKLKYMDWRCFPYKSLDRIEMCNVVVLRLECSRLETLWEGIKILKKLKILDVSKSFSLTRTGDLSGLENLEELYLRDCRSLKELHGSIGDLKKLAILDLMESSIPVKSIPWEKIGKKASLQKLFFGPDFRMMMDSYPDILMKVSGLTNLTHLTMTKCGVFQVPNEIGNLVSLKELDLSWNNFSILPDTLSNLSQLDTLDIYDCKQLQLLPLLPSNLIYIDARLCDSLDVISSASIRVKALCKESPFANRFMIEFTWKNEKVPEWCSYQNWGDNRHVLSFVAPVHQDDNICGIILCAYFCNSRYDAVLKMHNKTKGTSHRFYGQRYIMCYPLDDTTLMVEPGDHVVLEFPQAEISSFGFRLIYESDVVDAKLTLTKPCPLDIAL